MRPQGRAQHLPAGRGGEARRRRAAGVDVVALRRRGVHHGWVVTPRAVPPEDAAAPWRAARPVPAPGALAAWLPAARPLLQATQAAFEALRRGARFFDEVVDRLARHGAQDLRLAGSTVDLLQAREIEKVWVHGLREGRAVAREVWAKLSWIADDESDASLRVRFSCGTEQLGDWTGDVVGAAWADRFGEHVFPECALLAEHEPLRQALEALTGERVRLSERIVYSNAPGGGAVFHHDADPGQLGVIYGQLVGATAWLALPKRDLAEVLAAHVAGGPLADRAGTPERALRALDGAGEDEELWTVLDRDPAFSGRLVEHGALLVLRAGDVLLLPSHGPDDVAWHSVFALGTRPGLAHSFGVFPAGSADPARLPCRDDG